MPFKLALVFCLSLGATISDAGVKVYRTDYEYNPTTDAFYKLHIESSNRMEARTSCSVEGARLMTTSSDQDLVQLHRMLKVFPDLGNYVWVEDDGAEHESAEEPAVINFEAEVADASQDWRQQHCDVVTRDGEIEETHCWLRHPFICKVDASSAPFDRGCRVYGVDYQRSEALHSCYKVSRVAYSWNQAYAECAAEGAHLVVINSQAEHDHVQALMNNSTRIEASKANWFFYAGFRASPTTNGTPRVFKTIFNQTLEEAGFSTWAEGEPNNARNNENCGSLFKNDGNLNDVDCSHLFGFICEIETQTS